MAANDSGVETGYESNDSSMTVESPKSDSDSNNAEQQDSPPLWLPEAKFTRNPFQFEYAAELDPPAGLAFENVQPLGNQGYSAFLQDEHCNKIRASLLNRRHSIRWRRFSLPHLKDILGQRKLRLAASMNNIEAVIQLLDSGIDPRAADERRRTALHFAACKGYAEIVKILLDRGADPNQKDIIGNTALHLAACTNHINVVTLLLRAGTDVHSLDNCGRTPLYLAQSKLKFLQLDNSLSSHRLKAEVNMVIEMMQAYLQKSGKDSEVELLTAFSSRLNLTQTKEEVDSNVRDLLNSLSQLSLQRNET